VIFFREPGSCGLEKHRIKLVRKYIRKMLVIFPFEEPFYRTRGVKAEFVGHPLAELPLPAVTREQFAAANRLDPAATWDWPPSRQAGPGRFETICPDAGGRVAGRARLAPPRVTSSWCRWPRPSTGSSGPPVLALVKIRGRRPRHPPGGGCARGAFPHVRASVGASGTATVEAALIGNPFVVVYRVSWLTYAVAKRVVKVPHVAMANLNCRQARGAGADPE